MPKLDLFVMQDIPHPDYIEMAQLADNEGFENLWVIDGQDVFPDPWATAALCAVNTSRIRIGPGVTNPLTRHPPVTANAMLTIHELSGGRGILGMGAGDNAVRTMGWKPARVSEVREAVEICRERFKKDKADIPIYIAGGGPRMTAYACSAGDGIFMPGGGTAQDFRRVLGRIEIAVAQAGRDIRDLPILYYLGGFAISHDRRQALDDARGGIARRVRSLVNAPDTYPPELEGLRAEALKVAAAYDYSGHLKSHLPHTEIVSDELVAGIGIAGTPQEVIPKFKALSDAAAGLKFTFFLRPDGIGKKRTFELFVREVLPHLG